MFVINKLINLAGHLDDIGLAEEASEVGRLIKEGHIEPESGREVNRLNRIGRLIIYALRHKPEELNVVLDEHGWVDIGVLLEALSAKGYKITREQLEYLAETSDKQRFGLDASGDKIRANQGHTVDVDLGYEPQTPPEYLYHGTNREAVKNILNDGLHKMRRHAIHLSEDLNTAIDVGSRRGAPFMLRVQSGKMYEDGYTFHLSDNGVWLTSSVPIKYIETSFDNDDLTS